MIIESYQFGKIVIDGKTYTSDVIIIANTVHANWWRKEGHLLSLEDIQQIIDANPDTVIIGCGASGMMKVPDTVKVFLQENKIKFEIFDTSSAVKRFNELSSTTANIVAAFHLTC